MFGATIPCESVASAFRDVEINAFDVRQVMAAQWTAFEKLKTRAPLLAVSQRPRDHLRIDPDEFIHLALDLVDALHLEADMFETHRHRIMADEIRHFPRDDHER